MKITVCGEELELMPQRAIYLAACRALLIADLHVGKAESFQRRGVPVPSAVGDADLVRLSAALEATSAQALWVLGDLVHDSDAVETNGLTQLRQRHSEVAFHVVLGNHDRHVPQLPSEWGFEVHAGEVSLGGIAMRHDPECARLGAYTLCGHLHPMVNLRGAGDELLLPCFQFGASIGVLPAFTSWSSGVRVDPSKGRTCVIIGDDVREVPANVQ